MKSLAERKEQRKKQRAENLKDSPYQDTGVTDESGQTDSDGKAYSEMTIAELQQAAKDMGSEVPKDKTSKADVRTFVENLAKFKAADNDESEGNGSGWSAGAGA